jgi:alanyl-tRNA synthetase
LAEVEKLVNQAILDNLPVTAIETTQDLARDMGAVALLARSTATRYGHRRRRFQQGTVRRQPCRQYGGNCPVQDRQRGERRSGLRRIEAVTGSGALEYINGREKILAATAAVLKTRPEELAGKAEALLAEMKEIERELAKANAEKAKGEVQRLAENAVDVGGCQVIVAEVAIADIADMRNLADLLRDKLAGKAGVIVLAARQADKVSFVATATPQAVALGVHAGNIVKAAAAVAGGGGGGRPDMVRQGASCPKNCRRR